MPSHTVFFAGRPHQLTPRAERASLVETTWARELIEDPRAQHHVHLLLDQLVVPSARSEWTELMLELEEKLLELYECAPLIEDEQQSQAA